MDEDAISRTTSSLHSHPPDNYLPHLIPDNDDSEHIVRCTPPLQTTTRGNWIDDPIKDMSSTHRYPLRSHKVYNLQGPSRSPTPSPQTNAVIDQVTGDVLEYRHLIQGPGKRIWIRDLTNDMGRLAQGVGTRMPKGTNIIFFVKRTDIYDNCKVSYVRLVASMRHNKAETHRVRVAAGGN